MAQYSNSRAVTTQIEMESTYGTPPTFVPAEDAVLIYSELNPVQAAGDIFNPAPVRSSLSPVKGTVGGETYNLTLQGVLQGAEAIGTDVPWRLARALRACGLEETNVTTVSFTYTPRSTGFESVAAEVYYENVLNGNTMKHVLAGLFGSFTISSGQAGAQVDATFNLQGIYTAPTVAASITPTFAVAKPLAWKGVAGTFDNGSVRTPVIKSFSLDGGVSVTVRRDANAASGIIGYNISSRAPTFQWVIEMDTDIGVMHTDWTTGTTHDISFDMVPGATGNNVAFNAPAAWLNQAPTYVDVEGVRCMQLSYSLTGDDSEYTLVFT